MKKRKCPHGKVELLGHQKTEKGNILYYKCLRCGSVLVLSEKKDALYVIPRPSDIQCP
jgi:uncharacterized OB-fold protein